jgi:ppGpp synthetase/RelA/SpoT-type nucleotidyltranferase
VIVVLFSATRGSRGQDLKVGGRLDTVRRLMYHDDMAWAAREYSDNEINQAGRTLIDRNSTLHDILRAIEIINNWRAAHAYPLNTMQVRLRMKAAQVGGPGASVAQRIKRLPAIESKLRRLKHVNLVEMQDIAGCRAVVSTNGLVRKLSRSYQAGRIRHELERENDYIEAPTPDGYRSLHLVYRYYSDHRETYNGQRIEVQLRSRLQHAWATAVEAVDTFAGQQLKINLGSEDWERFFALMGSCMAIRERTSLVPNTPGKERELCDELRQLANDLKVGQRLAAIGATAHFTRGERRGAHYYLIDLDITRRRLSVVRYARDQRDEATKRLTELELEYRGKRDRDVLLVSVSSVSELRRMYPNYRADTRVFVQELERVTTG